MDDIINYIMENPDNTNPNVLRSMLENYSKSDSGALVVNVTLGEGGHFIMDKTAGNVYAAAQTGLVIVHYVNIYAPLIYAERLKSGEYEFYIVKASDWAPGVFTAAESTDYPTSQN